LTTIDTLANEKLLPGLHQCVNNIEQWLQEHLTKSTDNGGKVQAPPSPTARN
jgi:hypothetical protein